ncbi:uncharacterized protein [Channa argus]|uniref:uncharacterized protein isoform X3 n=1 Tax=Channa argus TaxID=215402 RepID=UPI00352183EE
MIHTETWILITVLSEYLTQRLSVLLLLSGLTVSADHRLVLKFSENPVMTGSDVTLYCVKQTKGDAVKAYFYFNETKLVSDPKIVFIIHKVQHSNEGFYSCATGAYGKSPESWLRVRDPPTTSDPHTTTSSTTSDPQTTALYTATAFNNTDVSASSSVIIIVVIVLCSLVLLILVMSGCLQLCRKQRGQTQNGTRLSLTQLTGPGPGLRRLLAGWTSLSLLCCLTVLPAAGVAVLLYGLTVPSVSWTSQDVTICHYLVW